MADVAVATVPSPPRKSVVALAFTPRTSAATATSSSTSHKRKRNSNKKAAASSDEPKVKRKRPTPSPPNNPAPDATNFFNHTDISDALWDPVDAPRAVPDEQPIVVAAATTASSKKPLADLFPKNKKTGKTSKTLKWLRMIHKWQTADKAERVNEREDDTQENVKRLITLSKSFRGRADDILRDDFEDTKRYKDTAAKFKQDNDRMRDEYEARIASLEKAHKKTVDTLEERLHHLETTHQVFTAHMRANNMASPAEIERLEKANAALEMRLEQIRRVATDEPAQTT